VNKTRWGILLASLISLGLIIGILYHLDIDALWHALRSFEFSWGLGAAVCTSLALLLRSYRWRLITLAKTTPYKDFWRANAIGYLSNLIFFGRSGEIVRIVIINRFSSLSVGQTMSSAIADRISDTLMLTLFIGLVLSIHGAQVLGGTALIIFLGLFWFGAGFIAVLIFCGKQWQGAVDRRLNQLPIPHRIVPIVMSLYIKVLEGISSLRNPLQLIKTMGLTAGAFTMDYLGIWCITVGFGWSLPVSAAITLGVFLGVGSLLPSLPGYVGVAQGACILALALYDVGDEHAVALSLILHLLAWGVLGFQGVVATFSYGLNPASLRTDLHFPAQSTADG
jgi:uncharacterized protein (TIRG00374 family)